MSVAPHDARERVAEFLADAQTLACERFAALEPSATFAIDEWENPVGGKLAGSGSTRTIAGGATFEKGGANTSIVTGGELPPSVVAQRPELQGHEFFAAGISIVMHPCNPFVPAAHCNVRYFETRAKDGSSGAWWFGGGADLTPYYPDLGDVRLFHSKLKLACDHNDERYYPMFKAWCDRYFRLSHRNEARGVGGIFYDYLDERGFGAAGSRTTFEQPLAFDDGFALMRDVAEAFVSAYTAIVAKRKEEPYGDRERAFQTLRRGRYVEFNLLYDRGTLFGLQSGGRTESILMSLPPEVRWAYDERPEPGSREAELAPFLQPRDWLSANPFET
ncbi:MAG TPA: oxygen-dependent coproporphyrinogen oxidase [Candidatus Tumulicola sp.]